MVMRGWLRTEAPVATILVRIVVGGVLLVEGVQKFLYPEALGSGRFAKIGIPAPEVMGPLVGGVETVCGAPIVLGLFTRLACVPVLVSMSVAIVSTKVPVLLSRGFWGFSLPKLDRYGVWSFIHANRPLGVLRIGVPADGGRGRVVP